MKIKCKICGERMPKRRMAKVKITVMATSKIYTLQTCDKCYTGNRYLITGFSVRLRDINTEKIKEIENKYGVIDYRREYNGP